MHNSFVFVTLLQNLVPPFTVRYVSHIHVDLDLIKKTH